jgi:hypothetical protein
MVDPFHKESKTQSSQEHLPLPDVWHGTLAFLWGTFIPEIVAKIVNLNSPYCVLLESCPLLYSHTYTCVFCCVGRTYCLFMLSILPNHKTTQYISKQPMQWRIETPVYRPIRTCHSTLWAKVGKDRIRQACHQLYLDFNCPTSKKPTSFKAVEAELFKRGLLTSTTSSSFRSSAGTDSSLSHPRDTSTAATNETTNVNSDTRHPKDGVEVDKENPTQVSVSSSMIPRVTLDDRQNVLDHSKRHISNDSQSLPPSKKYKLEHPHSLVGEETFPSTLVSS